MLCCSRSSCFRSPQSTRSPHTSSKRLTAGATTTSSPHHPPQAQLSSPQRFSHDKATPQHRKTSPQKPPSSPATLYPSSPLRQASSPLPQHQTPSKLLQHKWQILLPRNLHPHTPLHSRLQTARCNYLHPAPRLYRPPPAARTAPR